jgi:hypothetical protein
MVHLQGRDRAVSLDRARQPAEPLEVLVAEYAELAGEALADGLDVGGCRMTNSSG